MITLFISSKCPECPEAVQSFKASELNYKTVDITESMDNLRLFLKYRDSNSFFDNIKSLNQVGIPSIMIGDGKSFISYKSSLDLSKLKEE
ncbi:Glutaredoxin-related protein [Anaerosphaera aminiphila DSM 21120]|uniref:Glutaredoxin-related protein n=1 Tax=Anaerosphaera aminiphila DSM 21120 TaxID=1120995 RepID=A0A1M5USW2_9FIRM|nr:glutaredoxin domain-containing protein [Anaerosphaera aminiphila]SHH66061.1 Glutaredoxin-related protein [Anaerosphaera aminiphila DSM 21120]